MDFNKFAILARAFCLGLILSVFASPTWAVHDLGTFELEGNVIDDAVDGDDWENVYHGTSSANVTTDPDGNGILEDPAPKSIFTGGRKDIQDIPDWSHKDGAVPDKDDLTNAYAAAYGVDNDEGGKDLVIYFGADRYANKGDAFMGFWFFQQEVIAKEDGSFSGNHEPGDVLILVDYPQGANELPYAALILWAPECSKADSNDPVPGDCAAKNLRLYAETSDENSADCNAVNDGDLGCATTNLESIPSLWPYMPKEGVPNQFPYESFYEGGVNLSQLLKSFGITPGCFSSFMAESRSSASFTASLKDFVLGQFKLCGLELVKTCEPGVIQPDGVTIRYNYSLDVTNTGFGNLYDINATDITAGDYPNNGYMFYEADLTANETVTFTGYFDVEKAGVQNYAKVTAALTSGGAISLTATDDDSCTPPTPEGGVYLLKECDALVAENVDGIYGLKVKFSGEVCSTSDFAISVDVSETHDGNNPDPLIVGGYLEPNSCIPYYGEYVPAATDLEVGQVILADEVRQFTDTVSANAEYILSGGQPITVNSVQAACDLCLDAPERTALDEPEPEL